MRSIKRITLLFVVILYSKGAYSQQATVNDFGFYSYANSVTGDTLLYRLMKPFNYDSLGTTVFPVFIWMHPNGRQGNNNTNQMKDGWVNYHLDSLMRISFPAFIIAPQCKPNFFWNTDSYYRNVIYLIEHLKAVEKIDSDRIYVMGWSMGGFAVLSMVTDAVFPNYFAAAVPIAGGGYPSQNFDPNPYADTFIWAGHGNQDNRVNVSNTRKRVSLIRDAGHPVIYSEFKVRHGSHDETMGEQNIFTWIFSQTRSGGNISPSPTNLFVDSNGSTATLTWDIPTVTSSIDSIMAYNVYKNGVRITTDLSDLLDSTGTGLSELLRQNFFIDNNYSVDDIYEVTSVNYRNQESTITTNLIEIPDREDEVLLFPNPTDSYIQIKGDFPSRIEYSIFMIDGRIVQKGILENQEINIQSLKRGLHILQIGDANPIKFIEK